MSSSLLKFIILSVGSAFLLGGTASKVYPQYARGEIIDTIFCKSDPSQSYALYLPSNYDTLKKWPAIFIFEPAARGILPVTKFRPGAEQLGYILIASNNSRNGSWEVAFDAANAMFSDAFSRFSVDPARVYTSGFSGGSRVATSIAVVTGKVAVVIACGAGYANVPEYQPSLSNKFVYTALAGDQDMNYQEHIVVEKDLNNKKISNNLIVFPAGHEWPSSDFITEALYWLELQAYKTGKRVSSDFRLADAYLLKKQRADSIFRTQRLIPALKVYESIADDYKDLLDINDIKIRISAIRDSKEYKKQQRIDDKINNQELNYRFKFGEAFTELIYTRLKVTGDSSLKDMRWWQNEIDLLQRIAGKKDVDKRNMALRLLNMIWARCAETSFRYMDTGDFELAIILNKIWLYVEPKSIWGHWSMAKLYALTGEPTQAIAHLTKVAEFRPGLPESAIKAEPAFKEVINNPVIKRLLE